LVTRDAAGNEKIMRSVQMFKEIYEKEFGVRDVLAKTWSVYCKQFKALATIMLIVALPNIIINYIMVEYVAKQNHFTSSAMMVLVSVMIVVAFISFVALLKIILIVENTVKDDRNEMKWKTVLSKAFSKLASYIGTNLLAAFILFGLSLLLVIPGIIWSLYYVFFMQVVFLRGIGGKDALDYSKSLVKGRWWKVFWILFVMVLIYVAMFLVIGAISFFLPEAIAIILSICMYAAGTVFIIVGETILFLNLDYLSKKNRNATMAVDGDLEEETPKVVIH
jgi:hypothetical protein